MTRPAATGCPGPAGWGSRRNPPPPSIPPSLLRSKVPGIIRFAYATLAGLGVLAGLGLEALLLSHGHYSLLRPMLFSVIAIVAGVIGGKSWYIAVHRGRKARRLVHPGLRGRRGGSGRRGGAGRTGHPGRRLPGRGRAGAAHRHGHRPARVLLGRLLYRPADRRPLGDLVLRPPPGLPPCARPAAGGAGRADQRGSGPGRRGWPSGSPAPGPAAVAGLAVYTLGRQFILGLRSEARVWRYGRPVTAAIAVLALIAGVILLRRG